MKKLAKKNFLTLKKLKDKEKKLNAELKLLKDERKNVEELCIGDLKESNQSSFKIPDVGVFTLSEKREFYFPSTNEDKSTLLNALTEIMGNDTLLSKLSIMHTVFNSIINESQDEIQEYNKKHGIDMPEGMKKGLQILDDCDKSKGNEEEVYDKEKEGERLVNLNPYIFPGVKPGKIKTTIKLTKR